MADVPLTTSLGRLEVGPVPDADGRGCPTCRDLRGERASPARRLVGSKESGDLGPDLETGLARRAAAVVAEHLQDRRPTVPAPELFQVDLSTLEVRRHTMLPDPLCPDCGSRRPDGPEEAVVHLEPRPKPSPGVLRVRDVLPDLGDLERLYLGSEVGLVREMTTGHQGGLTVAAAMTPLRVRGIVEPGIGRTRAFATSRLVALLEALERWGGAAPTERQVSVEGTFDELREHALDPASLGGHDPALVGDDQSFEPYAPDSTATWVWGYSFRERRPLLVPEYLAYYYAHFDAERRPFLFEISNGCALGSCLEEAVLHGLLETLERDAFLMTWYARLPVPEIDLASAARDDVRVQVAAIEHASGCTVRCFDTTTEHGVPSVMVLAEAPAGSPGPAMICSAGAHPDQEQAALSGLSELGPLLWDLQRSFDGDRERAAAMRDDPTLVHSMHDHSVLYADPDAAGRLDFLRGSTPGPFRPPLRPDGDGSDLRADLELVLGHLHEVGLDVVVVDQTTAEHRAGGFRCVKVLVPGALPMTFGHRFRRLEGLSRLHDVPVALGHRAPGETWEPNPHPHPFP